MSREHEQAVSRRLAALSAELAAVRGEPPAPAPTPPPSTDPCEPERRGDPVPVPGRHARPSRFRPPELPGLVQLGPGQVAVLAVLVAVALAVTAWWVLRGQPREVTPVSGVVPVAPSSPAPASGSASTAAPAEVVVDVTGKVRRPGLVVLRAGSRVADALDAAGGARPGVDLSSLNLARPLVDGEQVLVGVDPPGGVAPPALAGTAAANPAGALVSLNSADQTALESLPQVGPVTAAAILAWRQEHGGFTSVDELLEVDGIGEATLARIAPFVTL